MISFLHFAAAFAIGSPRTPRPTICPSLEGYAQPVLICGLADFEARELLLDSALCGVRSYRSDESLDAGAQHDCPKPRNALAGNCSERPESAVRSSVLRVRYRRDA